MKRAPLQGIFELEQIQSFSGIGISDEQKMTTKKKKKNPPKNILYQAEHLLQNEYLNKMFRPISFLWKIWF